MTRRVGHTPEGSGTPSATVVPDLEHASRLAREIISSGAGIDQAHAALRRGIDEMDPWRTPRAEPGILLAALAASYPEAIWPDVTDWLGAAVGRADLEQANQPGLDEVLEMLTLLMPTPAARGIPRLLSDVLSTAPLHQRWSRRAVALLTEIRRWRPELLSRADLIALAERCDDASRGPLFQQLLVPLLLADPATVSLDLFQRACAVAGEAVEARYLAAAIAAHEVTPGPVRAAAEAMISSTFPLRAVWQRLCGQRGLRVLCVTNIADRQGDEIARVVPLLQALLDSHPETRVTLVTDRGYLYGHERLATLSFDDGPQVKQAIESAPDVLIEFAETVVRHLNHDVDLIDTIARQRAASQPALSIQASKGWGQFTFEHVHLGGLDWARPLKLDRPMTGSIYDPSLRLIRELGLPLRVGEQKPGSGAVLAAHRWPSSDAAWRAATDGNRENRPIALVNPFGGAGPLKGFVPRKFGDLAGLLAGLVEEGYFVVLCPTGTPWGSAQAASDVRGRLPDALRAQVAVGPDPAAKEGLAPLEDHNARVAPYQSVVMRQIISFVGRADLVVTIEGWMVHAAYLLGKPYRRLMLPRSEPQGWQPWGESAEQRCNLFAGDVALDRPPLPERPRKDAWISLLQRVSTDDWLDLALQATESEDADIRAAGARALGRIGAPVATPCLVALLQDRSHLVRGRAAEALLTAPPRPNGGAPAAQDGAVPDAEVLQCYRSIGQDIPDWGALGFHTQAALPALRAALLGDDVVVRREAALILERIERWRAGLGPLRQVSTGAMSGR